MRPGEIWVQHGGDVAILIVSKLNKPESDDTWYNVAPFGVYEDLKTAINHIRSIPSYATNSISREEIVEFYYRHEGAPDEGW